MECGKLEWVEAADPGVDAVYVVIASYPGYGVKYLSTRQFANGRWVNMGEGEVVAHWLDGLKLPE